MVTILFRFLSLARSCKHQSPPNIDQRKGGSRNCSVCKGFASFSSADPASVVNVRGLDRPGKVLPGPCPKDLRGTQGSPGFVELAGKVEVEGQENRQNRELIHLDISKEVCRPGQ